MIVPSAKLIRIAGLIVVPLATTAGVFPDLAGLCIGSIVLFFLLAGIDAARGSTSLEGLALTLPAVVRLTKQRPGTIPVQLLNRTNRERPIRLGLALPAELETPDETRRVTLPIASVSATLQWAVTPSARGRHAISTAHLETPSPFGLWDVRQTIPTACEVRVYPDLRTESRSVAALFLNRAGTGIHAQRQLGRGREFEKLRDYLPGDPVEDIHWRATAKRRHPVTKVHQIERTQEVYVVVDASRLSAREVPQAGKETRNAEPGTRNNPGSDVPADTVLEHSLAAALLLAAVAERQGDLFGIVAFDDQIRRFVRARSGRSHFAVCRDALHNLQSRPVSPDFGDLCTTLRLRLRRRALLVFLTALDDSVLAESFLRGVDLLARQHLVQVIQPRPEGVEPVFAHDHIERTDELYAALAGQMRWQKLRALETELRRHNVRFALADHDRLAPEIIRQYLEVKARQLI